MLFHRARQGCRNSLHRQLDSAPGPPQLERRNCRNGCKHSLLQWETALLYSVKRDLRCMKNIALCLCPAIELAHLLTQLCPLTRERARQSLKPLQFIRQRLRGVEGPSIRVITRLSATKPVEPRSTGRGTGPSPPPSHHPNPHHIIHTGGHTTTHPPHSPPSPAHTWSPP